MITYFLVSYLLAHAPIIGGDLRDRAFYKNDPVALDILEDITDHPTKYLPEGVYLITGYPDHKHQEGIVFGVQVNKGLLEISYVLNKGFHFRQIEIDSNLSILNAKDIALTDITWNLEIGLVERKIILTSDRYGIKRVYPIGSSAFDLGVSHVNTDELMTPRLTNAYLDPKRAVYASHAHGYNELPFVPWTKESGSILWNALHSPQHVYENPLNKGTADYNWLVRGMDSHGCIRLRMKELYEVYFIVMQSKKVYINTKYYLEDQTDSVYPMDNSYYNTVKNYGTVRYPQTRKAPAGYDVTETINEPPPFWRLKSE